MSDQTHNTPYQPKPGDLSLFTNEQKKKEDPILTGKLLLNLNELMEKADESGNIELRLALWGKKSKDGSKTFWAGKASPFQKRTEENTTNEIPGSGQINTSDAGSNGHGDDLPF